MMKKKLSNDYLQKGFSLFEIVIAIALLGLVMVSVCSVFAYGIESIKKGQKNAIAIHIGKKKLNELNNIDLNDPNGITYKSLCTSIEGYDPAQTPPTENCISWDITGQHDITGSEKIAGSSYNFTVGIEGFQPGLKKISVTVKWFDSEGKEKNFKLNTLLARKIYND